MRTNAALALHRREFCEQNPRLLIGLLWGRPPVRCDAMSAAGTRKSMRELKDTLLTRGVDISGIVERHELEELYKRSEEEAVRRPTRSSCLRETSTPAEYSLTELRLLLRCSSTGCTPAGRRRRLAPRKGRARTILALSRRRTGRAKQLAEGNKTGMRTRKLRRWMEPLGTYQALQGRRLQSARGGGLDTAATRRHRGEPTPHPHLPPRPTHDTSHTPGQSGCAPTAYP